MNRELPQPGERWRHFKEGEYVIIAIARDFINRECVVYSKVEHDQSQWSQYVRVFDTESPTVFWMGRTNPNPTVLTLTPSNEVWHPSDKTEQTLWARPLYNFMGVVSSPCGDQSSNCYRFEKIADSVPA